MLIMKEKFEEISNEIAQMIYIINRLIKSEIIETIII